MLCSCLQVGRAGRDGEPASCHLFLDDADFLRLRSLAHTDGVDAAAIASFLRSVFDADAEVHGCIVCWCERALRACGVVTTAFNPYADSRWPM
jgi:hypothetical protein